METKTKAIIVTIALLASFGAGRFSAPTKVVTKTETKIVEKIVEKEKETIDKNKKNDKVVIIVETVYPDGRRVKETKIVDKGSVTVSVDKQRDSTADTSATTTTEKTVERFAPSWTVIGYAAKDISNLATLPSYGLGVSKRILGPFHLGAFGLSNGIGGFTLGVQF